MRDERIGCRLGIGDHVRAGARPWQCCATGEQPPARIDRREISDLAELAMELGREACPASRAGHDHQESSTM
jgi:hypothetical protein